MSLSVGVEFRASLPTLVPSLSILGPRPHRKMGEVARIKSWATQSTAHY